MIVVRLFTRVKRALVTRRRQHTIMNLVRSWVQALQVPIPGWMVRKKLPARTSTIIMRTMNGWVVPGKIRRVTLFFQVVLTLKLLSRILIVIGKIFTQLIFRGWQTMLGMALNFRRRRSKFKLVRVHGLRMVPR